MGRGPPWGASIFARWKPFPAPPMRFATMLAGKLIAPTRRV